jgi:uncharacterized protein
MDSINRKYNKLKSYIKQLDNLLIAYSGGIDSTFLLKVAYDALGMDVLAVTSDSPSVPRKELEESKQLAKKIGARHLVVKTNEINNNNYKLNPANRCYFCKHELYSELLEIAKKEGIKYIANGTNIDDLGDFRPGLEAAQEFQIVSPLKEAGLTKNEIRELAKNLRLEIWDKPASPCLSSRIPYGSSVTIEKLSSIEKAEDFLRTLNIKEVRVRHFGETARIETLNNDYEIIKENLDKIEEKFISIGFKSIQWKEFRSGALNEMSGRARRSLDKI